MMPLAIFGVAGVRFSHVGREASLNPHGARVRALAGVIWQSQHHLSSSAPSSSPAMVVAAACTSSLPAPPPCLPSEGPQRLGEGQEHAGQLGLTRDVSTRLIFLAA